MTAVLVGTSGWQYADWRETFYPRGLAQRNWLAYYAGAFGCVEVNSTFYNLPTVETVARWREQTPADFRFVLKASRYLTHVRRLRDPQDSVKRFLERARPIRRRLAAVLVQLPPNFSVDVARLRATLHAFPRTLRIAVEFRDKSWFVDDVRALLQQHDVALCLADRKNELEGPDWNTASWSYVRFHEGEGTPYPCYSESALDAWAGRFSAQDPSGDAYAFFNNDSRACALHDAAVFAGACRHRGLAVSRTPGQIVPA